MVADLSSIAEHGSNGEIRSTVQMLSSSALREEGSVSRFGDGGCFQPFQ
jgi:hypothetical protein